MKEQLNQFKDYVLFWQEEICLRVDALDFNSEQDNEDDYTTHNNETLIPRAI